ncbi:hypothetical protein ABIF96_002117 [Bradyrhizobium ottawaense]
MKIRFFLLLPLLISLVPTAPSLAAGDRFALVIGNAKYPDADAPLKEPINDARDVADELKRDGFSVEIAENLTGDGMRRAFDKLYGKIKPGSVALVFFSGFGIQSARQSYMLPIDAQIWTESDVRRDGFSLETVLGELNTRGAGVKIALIDASRRNPFERRFRSFSAGLTPVIAPNGTLVMYSAGAGLGGLRRRRRAQPVRPGAPEGNPGPRPDGRGDTEPDQDGRHPRVARRAGAVDILFIGRRFLVQPGSWRVASGTGDAARASRAAAGRRQQPAAVTARAADTASAVEAGRHRCGARACFATSASACACAGPHAEAAGRGRPAPAATAGQTD